MAKTPVYFDRATALIVEDVEAVNRFQGATFVHIKGGKNFRVATPLAEAVRIWMEGLAGRNSARTIQFPATDYGPPRMSISTDLGVDVEVLELGPGDGFPDEERKFPFEIILLRGRLVSAIGNVSKELEAPARIAYPNGGVAAVNATEKSLVAILRRKVEAATPKIEKVEA